MVDWPSQTQAACWAAFSCLSDTSVLLSPQNQLSMKTRLAKHSDSSELSHYFTCVDTAQWADSVLSVHSIWDYTCRLWCSAFCLHTVCLVLARPFSSPSLPLPPSTIKCRGITYSHQVVPPQPCSQTGRSVNGEPTWWPCLGYCRNILLPSNLKTASAV